MSFSNESGQRGQLRKQNKEEKNKLIKQNKVRYLISKIYKIVVSNFKVVVYLSFQIIFCKRFQNKDSETKKILWSFQVLLGLFCILMKYKINKCKLNQPGSLYS